MYRVPDSAVDGFRLVWQNVQSARRYGAGFRTYTEVTAVNSANGAVTGVSVRIRARAQTGSSPAPSWSTPPEAGLVKSPAPAGLTINVKPDRGTLVAFNHRFTSRVINRLRKASDGDIFVPHGSITILGTTSKKTERPDDTVPDTGEVRELLDIGRVLFPDIDGYRILRTFAGTPPPLHRRSFRRRARGLAQLRGSRSRTRRAQGHGHHLRRQADHLPPHG